MRFLFIYLSVVFTNIVNGQSEYDFPVKYKSDYNKNVSINNQGLDSALLLVDVMGMDYDDRNLVAVYAARLYSKEKIEYYKIVLLSAKDSSKMNSSYRIPEKCVFSELTDTSLIKQPNSSKFASIGTGGSGNINDSLYKLKEKCIADFYKINNDSVRTDTLFFEGDFEWSGEMFDLLWKCEYLYENKHGLEKGFYSIVQLRNKVYKGEEFRLKYTGYWKNGLKHGEWVYYDISGRLEKKEKYKKGVLKKSKTY